MTFSAQLLSLDSVPRQPPSSIPMVLGTCEDGVPGSVYSFDPGADVRASLGHGRAAQLVAHLLNSGNRVHCSPVEPVWQALPACAQTGSGPAITAALTGADGPFDSAQLTIAIANGGALGVARGELFFDGGGVAVRSFPLPPEQPAVLRGTRNASFGLVLNQHELEFTTPAASVTFGPGSVDGDDAGLKAATATIASPVTWTTIDLLAPGLAALASNGRLLLFTTAGTTPSDAPATATVTGTVLDANGDIVAGSEIITLAQTAAQVVSTKIFWSVTSVAFPAADGTGATIKMGYSDAHANAYEILDELNALLVAGDVPVTARLHEAADGDQFIELVSTAVGTGATLDLATGTPYDARTALGLSATATTGADATASVPELGITLTFPSGTYVAGTTYVWPVAGPLVTLQSVLDAAYAAKNSADTTPFGFFVLADPQTTNAAAVALHDALTALEAQWLADAYRPLPLTHVLNSALHTASATKATNQANIQANDANLIAELASSPACFHNITVDDCYVLGSPAIMAGWHRRPASWAWALAYASAEFLGASPGKINVPNVSLRGPDELTFARDESTATTKLGGIAGIGVAALRSRTRPGEAYFALCPTRAGATSNLRDPGDVRAGLAAIYVLVPILSEWQADKPPSDPSSPDDLSPEAADEYENAVRGVLDGLWLPREGRASVSAYDVQINGDGLRASTELGVSVPYNPLLGVGKISLVIGASGAALQGAG